MTIMTIDEVIRKSRREAELRGEDYYTDDLYEPYIPPKRTIDLKKYIKLGFEIIFKFVFFILMLYGVWIGLSKLNEAVDNGTLQTKDFSFVEDFKKRYNETVTERNNIDDMADNLTEKGPILEESESGGFNVNDGIEEIMGSTLDKAMERFDSLIGQANDAMDELNNSSY